MDLFKMFSEKFIELESICNSIMDGVVIADAAKEFIYWNHAAKEILATEPHFSRPDDWAKEYGLFRLNGDYLPYDQLPMIRALHGEKFKDYLIMTKNALQPEGKILSVNGHPLKSGEATVGGITTFRDITKSYIAEKKLHTDRLFFERILDLLPGLVFIKDMESKFLYGNKAFYELLNTQTLIGKSTFDVLNKEMSEKIVEHDQKVLRTGQAHVFDEIIYWDKNKRSIFSTLRFPYRDEKGKIIGVCAVARDITKEVDEKIALEHERDKTAHVSKLAAIGVLAAEIAHEIKTPLTILGGNMDIIRLELEEKEIDRQAMLSRLEIMKDTLIDKVSGSLNLLSKDASQAQPEKFKVKEIIEDMLAICSFRTKKLRMEIRISSQGEEEMMISANRVQISEVLMNLVNNSLDAIEKNPHPKLEIFILHEGNNLLIKVKDNGPGVDPSIQERIFDAFFTTKDPTRGTGLGLSISKKIMDKHNGDLFYEEQNGTHAFVMTLPLEKRPAT